MRSSAPSSRRVSQTETHLGPVAQACVWTSQHAVQSRFIPSDGMAPDTYMCGGASRTESRLTSRLE